MWPLGSREHAFLFGEVVGFLAEEEEKDSEGGCGDDDPGEEDDGDW